MGKCVNLRVTEEELRDLHLLLGMLTKANFDSTQIDSRSSLWRMLARDAWGIVDDDVALALLRDAQARAKAVDMRLKAVAVERDDRTQ